MKTSSKKVFALVGVGVVSATLLGLGAWGIYSAFKNDEKAEKNVGDEVKYNFKDFGFPALDLEIGQYETKMPDGSYDYFLNKDGIKYLVQRFMETGNYGPEIFNLKKIWIGNVNFTDDHENGMYVPDTAEIGLNARNDALRLNAAANDNNVWINDSSRPESLIQWDNAYRTKFLETYAKGSSVVSFTDQRVRAELVFQTLAHEYGHHLAHSYFSSPFGAATPTEVKNGSSSGKNYWNTNFLNDFKSILNYDKKTAKVSGSAFTNAAKVSNLCIGEMYDAKDLWDNANKLDKDFGNPFTQYKDLAFYYSTEAGGSGVARRGEWTQAGNKGNPVLTFPSQRVPYELTYTYADNTDTLSYLYSQEELFTRKVLLASTAVGSTADEQEVFNNIVRSKLRTDLFEEQEKIQTNYLLNSNGGANIVSEADDDAYVVPRGAKYLQDDPFATSTTSKDMMELVNKHIGHASGDDISFIFNDNQYRVVEKGKMGTQADPNTYRDKIRFGGYISNNNLNCIVSLNADGTVNKKLDDIQIIDFNLGYKSSVFSQGRKQVSGTDKYTYVTKNFINKSEFVVDRKARSGPMGGLAFAHQDAQGNIDATSITPLNSFRGESSTEYGLASNYLENQPSTIRQYNPSTGKYSFVVPITLDNGKIALGIQEVSVAKGA